MDTGWALQRTSPISCNKPCVCVCVDGVFRELSSHGVLASENIFFPRTSSENILNFNTTRTDWFQEVPGKVWEKTSEYMF